MVFSEALDKRAHLASHSSSKIPWARHLLLEAPQVVSIHWLKGLIRHSRHSSQLRQLSDKHPMPLAQVQAVVLEDFSSRMPSNLAKQEHLARLNQLLVAFNKNQHRHCLVVQPLAFSSQEPWVNNKLKD